MQYWSYGPIWAVGGYYPTVGYRASATAKIVNYSTMAYYWSATPYLNPDDHLVYHGSSYNLLVDALKMVSPETMGFRANAMSVRCVKE